MDVDRCRDLRPGYEDFALGVIGEHDALRVRVHLSEGCARCAAEIEALMAAFFTLPLAGGGMELPEGLIDGLEAAAGRTPQERPEPAIVYPDENQLRLAWTMVALCALAVLAVVVWASRHDGAGEAAEQRARVAEAQTRRVVDDHRLYQQQTEKDLDALELMKDPLSLAADLVDGSDVVRGRAFAHWPRRSLLLSVPAPPPDDATVVVARLRAAGNTALLGPLPAGPGDLHPFPLPEPVGGPVRLELVRVPVDDPGADGTALLTAEFPSPAPPGAPPEEP